MHQVPYQICINQLLKHLFIVVVIGKFIFIFSTSKNPIQTTEPFGSLCVSVCVSVFLSLSLFFFSRCCFSHVPLVFFYQNCTPNSKKIPTHQPPKFAETFVYLLYIILYIYFNFHNIAGHL